MPRLVFESLEDLKKWMKEQVRPKAANFVIFYTKEDHEIIVHPIVSTRPIFVGYYKCKTEENTEQLANELAKEIGLRVYPLQRLEWDLEKPVGIKIPV